MIYPVSGQVVRRGEKPKARNMPGFASLFQEGEVKEAADETEELEEEAEEAEAEGEEDEAVAAKGWALGSKELETGRVYG